MTLPALWTALLFNVRVSFFSTLGRPGPISGAHALGQRASGLAKVKWQIGISGAQVEGLLNLMSLQSGDNSRHLS